MRFGWEADIERPMDEIVAALRDPQSPLEWQPGLARIEPISGHPGREGSVSEYVFDLDGNTFRLTETVVVDRLPEQRTTRYEGRGMRHKITHELEAAGSGHTTLRAIHEGHLTGMARLMALPLRNVLRQRWRLEFAALCGYLESA